MITNLRGTGGGEEEEALQALSLGESKNGRTTTRRRDECGEFKDTNAHIRTAHTRTHTHDGCQVIGVGCLPSIENDIKCEGFPNKFTAV
jgi:hypothetical protein